jgi:hypothetical protein
MLAFVAFTFLESMTFDSSISFVFKGFTVDASNKAWVKQALPQSLNTLRCFTIEHECIHRLAIRVR